MMHILIVKMSSLGDIIQTFPVLDFIKHCYPSSEIEWVVEKPFAELVQAHPAIDRVITIQTKKWRKEPLKKLTWQEISLFQRELRQSSYDVILDLQGNVKSALVTASAKSLLKVGFGYSSVPEWPNILATNKRWNPPKGKNIREDYLFIAQNAFNNFTHLEDKGVKLKLTKQEINQLNPVLEHCNQLKGLKVIICPGSNWPNKQLSKETLKNFLHCFSEQFDPHFLFIWGNQEEKIVAEELTIDLPQRSSVIEKLPLPSLQNLMAHVDLIIAMDSLPLHLASTTSTPTYSIFGASSANKYKPMGLRHIAFQGTCPYGKQFEKRCDLLRSCKTGACVKEIEGHLLFDHFLNWWINFPK